MTGIAPRPDRTLPESVPRRPSSTARIVVVVGVVLLVALLIVAGLVVAVLPFAFRTAVSQRFDVAGGTDVRVAVSDAGFEFARSGDGRVHVLVSGWSPGAPSTTVRTTQGHTVVEGGCRTALWFSSCALHVVVTMPPSADLSVTGTNGAVVARGLHGAIDATTTNGLIDLRGASGTLGLHTTNGSIHLADADAPNVQADTTNGAVSLRFTAAPASVDARTTNGAVTVLVPGSGQYAVTAHTTDGRVDTASVRTDPAAPHRISAETTNGSIRVAPSSP